MKVIKTIEPSHRFPLIYKEMLETKDKKFTIEMLEACCRHLKNYYGRNESENARTMITLLARELLDIKAAEENIERFNHEQKSE